MSELLSDELALQKANSMDWFDNQAGMTSFVKPRPKKLITKKPKVDINDLKQKLASSEKKRAVNPDHNSGWKEKELQVHAKFKRLVKDRLGDGEYISLIEKADEMAKADIEAGRRLEVS